MMQLTLIGKSWKINPENFPKFQFSGSWARRFYWKTNVLNLLEFNVVEKGRFYAIVPRIQSILRRSQKINALKSS